MENKQIMNIAVIKHTGKSVMCDDSSKRVSIKLMEINPTMTIYKANMEAHGLIIEDTDKGLLFTITKGGNAIKSMSMDEFIKRLTD